MKCSSWWLICVGLLVASAAPSMAQESEAKIVFVNLDSVFTNYNKTKLAEAQLKEQSDEIKAELQELVDQLEKVQADYQGMKNQAQSTALSEDARSAKRAEAEEKLVELRDMENKIRRTEESAKRRMEEQSRRTQKRLVEEMNQLIREYAIARGYEAIIDSSGNTLNGLPAVVFFNPKLDVTEEIIYIVNKKGK